MAENYCFFSISRLNYRIMRIKNPINFIRFIKPSNQSCRLTTRVSAIPSSLMPPHPLANSRSYFQRHLTLAIVFLLAAGCALTVFLSFLAGDRTFLFRDIGSDSVNISYPLYCQASFYLHQYGFPVWSAHQGLGQAFSGLSFGDPFAWPVILQSNPVSIAKSIGVMESIKCLSSILLFAAFLRYAGVGRLALLLGALSYGLSGYLILGSCWNVFSTEAVYLAMLLLATERFIQRGSIWLIPIPICLIGMLQPFYYWGFGLFTLAYLLLRRAELRTEAMSTRTGVLTEACQILLFGTIAAIGVLASSVFTFSSLNLMLQSPRVGGEASYAHYLLDQPILQLASAKELLTVLYRTFSTDMLGIGSGFTGWTNYLEAPVFYCGLFMLLLIPQLFVMSEKRLRGLYYGILALTLIPLFFPWIRHAFWLFQGDYYRLFSLLITTTFILLGVRVLNWLEAGKRLNITVLVSTMSLIMVCLFAIPADRFKPYAVPGRDITLLIPPPEYQNHLLLNQPLRNITLSLLVGYTLLMIIWSWLNIHTESVPKQNLPAQCKFKFATNLVKGVLLTSAVLELICFARITLNERPVVTKTALLQKINYNDYTVDTLAALRSSDQTPFYRVNKTYMSSPAFFFSYNDAMIQNFYGTSCYTQFNQINYIRFLDVMGILNAKIETETHWCAGLIQRPLLQIWASTKYCLTKTPARYRELLGVYEEVGTWGNVTAFRYRQSLPFGFTYDKFVDTNYFHALHKADKEALLFRAAVLESADLPALSALPPYNPANDTNPFDLNTCVANLSQSTLKLEMFQPDHFRGHIELNHAKLLFFTIPFDPGWQATVDGRPTKLLKINIGFTGLMLSPGLHTLEMQYKPPLLILGLIFSGCGFTIYCLLLVWRYRRHRKPI